MNKETTIKVFRVICTNQLKIVDEVKAEFGKEKKMFYSGSNWPYFEDAHDKCIHQC